MSVPTLFGLKTKADMSAALERLERAAEDEHTFALLSAAYQQPRAHVVGMTGPPGVGKSTLMSALIGAWREAGKTVACIAVDPSSRRTGGALLGDRTRLAIDPTDVGVFVRSMAARDRLGGLAALTIPAMILMRACYDYVLIETVGVGQSEVDVANITDTVIFCVQPGSGDSLQFMKSGIVEIPHIVVVTKADMEDAAARALSDVSSALHLSAARDGWTVPVLPVSAESGMGVASLAAAINEHAVSLAFDGNLAAIRHAQAEQYLAETIRERFGREGLRRVGNLCLAPFEPPFRRIAEVSADLAKRLG